jgi:uncharacterized protein (DUF885 family)
MPRLRAIFGGALLGVWLFNSVGLLIEFSVIGGLAASVLYDAPHNSQQRRRLSKIASEQSIRINYGEKQLLAFVNQCDQLQIMVHSRDEQLRTALLELERRDSVGAPEARKLIGSQRKSLKVQKKSMEEAQQLIRAQQRMLSKLESQTNAGHDRWEETLASLERMLSSQASHNNSTEQQLLDQITNGNRELQKTLTDLLQQLAMEPRTSNVNVQDSVVMKSGPEINYQQSPSQPDIPTIQAIPIGKPQRTTEVEWIKSLPKNLI